MFVVQHVKMVPRPPTAATIPPRIGFPLSAIPPPIAVTEAHVAGCCAASTTILHTNPVTSLTVFQAHSAMSHKTLYTQLIIPLTIAANVAAMKQKPYISPNWETGFSLHEANIIPGRYPARLISNLYGLISHRSNQTSTLYSPIHFPHITLLFTIFTAHIYGKVMFSYHLSVCLSVRAIPFECHAIETSSLARWYILTISHGSHFLRLTNFPDFFSIFHSFPVFFKVLF